MNIGERIKEKRESLGLSQEDLAKKVGYKSRSSINKIEIDGRGLPQRKIKAFADALGTTPAYLMGWEEEVNFIDTLTSEEIELIKKYRSLDDYGKRTVRVIAQMENARFRNDDADKIFAEINYMRPKFRTNRPTRRAGIVNGRLIAKTKPTLEDQIGGAYSRKTKKTTPVRTPEWTK